MLGRKSKKGLKLLPPGMGIIIVDMQDHFLKTVRNPKRDQMVSCQVDVLECAAQNDYPVIVLEYRGSGPTNKEISDRVKEVRSHDYLTKSRDNGFWNTELNALLRDMQITTLCMMGINASYCVKSTAEGGLEEGLDILTAEPLIADGWDARRIPSYTIDWYKSESVGFFDDHRDLITLMSAAL
jgi:nicotinamidase-related amidase